MLKWIDKVWRFYTGHCPCCHSDFQLAKVVNQKLNRYRQDHTLPGDKELATDLDRRLATMAEADSVRVPHETQLLILEAKERHVAGKGAARAGKSFLLGMLCFLALMIPGVEIWILARIYSNAESEMQYVEDFLRGIFTDKIARHMYKKYVDSKSGEVTIETRWGSIIKIMSGKAKGSITGRELELAAVAEPAWVPGELYEELRARMSSRLGRIVALGTPKGMGGFLNRMVKLGGKKGGVRDKGRLISDGWPWGKSLLIVHMNPEANPAYVKSEIEAARGELTDEEFAAEFEGLMVSAEGSKFPYIQEESCRGFSKDEISRCTFFVGIDQGERNFGAVLVGYDGEKIYTIWEYFDKSDSTIKANLIELNKMIPRIISIAGGNPENWVLTIFDSDPIPENTLLEMENEHREWRTPWVTKPKNVKDFLEWREDTCIWVNTQSAIKRVLFDEDGATMLHDQLMEAQRDTSDRKKGWHIDDARRGDHVPDAWLMAMFLLFSNQIEVIDPWLENTEPVSERQKLAMDGVRIKEEKRELAGYVKGTRRERESDLRGDLFSGTGGWYPDES
jgi:hypothetical protein